MGNWKIEDVENTKDGNHENIAWLANVEGRN